MDYLIVAKKQHTFFHIVGLGLCGLGVLLSFFAFAFSLRGFGVGIWPQSESLAVAVHISSLVASVGLLLLSFRSRVVFSLFRKPLVFIPFLIGVLSAVLLLFHELPMRSFLGSARTGEGVVWWFDLSVLTASALLLWRFQFWRRAIVWAVFGSFVVIFSLSVSHKYLHHYIGPFYFSDYLAFMIVCLLPFVYAWWAKISQKFAFYGVFYVALNILLFLTDNKAMVGFGLFIPIFFGALWWVFKKYATAGRVLSLSAVAAVPIFLVALFVGITKWQPEQGYYAFIDSGAFNTVASRSYLVDVSLQSQIQDPASFVTGHGWGSYVEHLVRYQPSQWIDFTDFKRAQWDGLTFDHFHSHNMFIETLNTVGVLGCVLLFLYFLSFSLFAKASMRASSLLQGAGFMIWGSLWFLFPIHLPFMAFAAASTAGRFVVRDFWGFSKIFPVALIFVGILQGMAAFIIFSTALNVGEYEPQSLNVQKARNNCSLEYQDFGAGGLHLSKMMLDRLRYTVDLTDPESVYDGKEGVEAIAGHVAAINHLFCQSAVYQGAYNISARLQIARLMMRGEVLLALYDYIDDETRAYYYDGWESDLKAWLVQNPVRSDQATPYLLYHVLHGQEGRAADIVDLIYKQNPNDPIGLWFKGLSMLADAGTSAQGIVLMRQALAGGIERFVPIESDLKAMLQR